MCRTTKTIWMVILAFASVVLLGRLPAVAFDAGIDISNVRLTAPDDNRAIVTEIDGITPKNPKYDEGDGDLKPMYPATEAYICKEAAFAFNPPGAGDTPDLSSCRRVATSTFGAAWNTWVCWGGRWFYIAP